jgi:hypothetical protein
MRLYEHYRARAIWNQYHGRGAKPTKSGSTAKTLTLAKTRDGWVKDAYQKGAPAFIARTNLAS